MELQQRVPMYSASRFETSMKTIEEAYWYYMDVLVPKGSKRMTFSEYVSGVNGIGEGESYGICKRWDKYKKSIPTAGVIMWDPYVKSMLMVRINGSDIWSMPKGKAEKGERIDETAVREFQEETGLELDVTLREKVTIMRTVFYYVESEVREIKYKTNEIAEVGWSDRVTGRKSRQAEQVLSWLSRRVKM
jgi:hypothetical protein